MSNYLSIVKLINKHFWSRLINICYEPFSSSYSELSEKCIFLQWSAHFCVGLWTLFHIGVAVKI